MSEENRTPKRGSYYNDEFDVDPELLNAHITEVFYLDNTEQVKVLSFVQRIANIIAHIACERYDFMDKLDAIAQLTR